MLVRAPWEVGVDFLLDGVRLFEELFDLGESGLEGDGGAFVEGDNVDSSDLDIFDRSLWVFLEVLGVFGLD